MGSLPLSGVYNCFEAFFRRYMLNLYYDEEFNSLEFLFRMVTIILKYHDPSLARFLGQHGMTPELYATPWFMTLLSNKLSIQMAYLFWEIYILEDDIYLIFYVIVALLLHHRSELLQTRPSDLPQHLTELTLSSSHLLEEVYKKYIPINIEH